MKKRRNLKEVGGEGRIKKHTGKGETDKRRKDKGERGGKKGKDERGADIPRRRRREDVRGAKGAEGREGQPEGWRGILMEDKRGCQAWLMVHPSSRLRLVG